MAFLTRTFLPGELAIFDLPRHDARMWEGSCNGNLFPLLQHVHEFFLGIKEQDLFEGTRYGSVLLLLAIWRAEKLN